MNVKKFVLASIVVFVIYEIVNYLIHGFILMGAYQASAAIWRADMNNIMWIMWLGDLVKAFIFVYIFTKGIENKGWMEGLRYGLWIGLYVAIGMGFSSYVTYPIPFGLAFQWFIYTTIQLIICGAVTALVYKPAKA